MGVTADLDAAGRWERCYQQAAHWAPHGSLAIGTLFAILDGGASRPTSLALLGVTLVWVLLLGPRRSPQDPRGHLRYGQAGIRVYFAGYVLLAALLNLHQGLFFVVAIAGFFQVWLLSPNAVVVLGVLGASLAVNLQILVGGELPGALVPYALVVVIQTAAIGAGALIGEKLEEQSERRRQAVEALEAALAENTRLQEQLVEQARAAGVGEERQRLAREIHDTIAQDLVGVVTQVEGARRAATGGPEAAEVARRLDAALSLARDALAEARRSVRAVRPLALEGRPLHEALEVVVDRWAEGAGVDASFAATGAVRALHPEVEATLLRVTQEALANVGRHARATRVGVTLSYMDDVAAVDVRDDGVGFDPEGVASGVAGFGLATMRQRVARLAGVFEVESSPGRGTAVSGSVPAVPAEEDPVVPSTPAGVAEAVGRG